MSLIKECPICCNELNNIVCCNNCSKNKDDPKHICQNCIVKLNLYRIYLLNNDKLIEDEHIKKNSHFDNLLIQYTCPYCNDLSEYKLNDIIDKDNIRLLTIYITKYLNLLLYKNHVFVNKLIQDNIKLKKKIKLLECNFPVTILVHNKYIIVFSIIIVNSLIYLFIVLINQLIQ